MRRFWKPVCTTRKSYEDKGVQLFNNKVLRSRSLIERPTKVPNVNSLVDRRTRRGVGEGGRPLALKISGQTLFLGQAQVAQKSRMVQNISVQWKIIAQILFFRARASCSKILNDKKYIFSTVKYFRAHSVFSGQAQVAQNPECEKYIQYSEKFQGKCKLLKNPECKIRQYSIQPKILGQTLFFGQAQVPQKSWMINSIYSIQWKILGQLSFSGQAQSCSKILNGKKYIQYSEKFWGKLCSSGQAQVDQKSWAVKKFSIQRIFTWGWSV